MIAPQVSTPTRTASSSPGRLYDGGTVTRTSPSLAGLAPAPSCSTSTPSDLARLGVADGDRLRVALVEGRASRSKLRRRRAITKRVVALVHTIGDGVTSLIDGDGLATDVRLETL